MKNIYLPEPVKITRIEELSPIVKLFRLQKIKGKFEKQENGLVFTPGQFFIAGLWGYGEAPFGGASDPYNQKYIDLIIRKTGNTTNAFHALKNGDEMTLRGPYCNGYPLKFLKNKDLVMVTGGCGIPPIASLVKYIIKNRKKFNRVYLLYGSATPADLLLKNDLKKWGQFIKVLLTIDKPAPDWKGHVGWVSELVEDIKIDPINAIAVMCGPGPMVHALENVLNPLGISDKRIFVADERKMQCAVGKCQHCTTGKEYVCVKGPVFNLDQIDKNYD